MRGTLAMATIPHGTKRDTVMILIGLRRYVFPKCIDSSLLGIRTAHRRPPDRGKHGGGHQPTSEVDPPFPGGSTLGEADQAGGTRWKWRDAVGEDQSGREE